MLTASDLFALSQLAKNAGPDACHWCGSACERLWLHDDPPPVPFRRSTSTALNPAGAYLCLGCWLWRRKRQTIRFLAGGLRDGQCAEDHSWWVTEKGAWAVRPGDYAALLILLRDPPHRFALILKTDPKGHALLQLARANDHAILKADEPLWFTVDGTPFRFNIYELNAACEDGTSEGKWPGVDMLLHLLGRPAPGKKEKLPAGRPQPAADGRETIKVIRRSGQREPAAV